MLSTLKDSGPVFDMVKQLAGRLVEVPFQRECAEKMASSVNQKEDTTFAGFGGNPLFPGSHQRVARDYSISDNIFLTFLEFVAS